MSPPIIERLIRHLVQRWGLRKVRLTGGEPTTRPDLIEIIERLSRLDGLGDLAMTTNGLTLARHAAAYRQAGLHRINVSLDSLDGQTFHRMTGVRGPDSVMAGIDAARAVDLCPIRLNTVVVAGENDRQLPDLVYFAAERALEIRFIELMPMGPLADRWAERYISERVMRDRLAPIVRQWQPIAHNHDSARRFCARLHDGRQVAIGFITPMSCNFCATCNRLRITAAADVYPCLMDKPRGNLAAALTPRFDGEHLDRLLVDCLQFKAREHPASGFTTMTVLGG